LRTWLFVINPYNGFCSDGIDSLIKKHVPPVLGPVLTKQMEYFEISNNLSYVFIEI